MRSFYQGIASVVLAFAACAQNVPPLINYQGRLANPDGSPFPTADYELSVSLYDAPVAGRLLWGPQRFDNSAVGPGRGPRIPVVQGYFNLMLGPTDTNGMSLADALTNSACFVEVTVSNRPPILPRQRIISVPFAVRAGDVSDGAITSSKLASNAVNSSHLIPNAVTWDRQAIRSVGVSSVLPGQVGWSAGTVGSWSSPSPRSYTLVPGLEVTMATTGRPVHLFLTCKFGATSQVVARRSSGNSYIAIALHRVDVASGLRVMVGELVPVDYGFTTLAIAPGCIQFLDVPARGQFRYEIEARSDPSTGAEVIFSDVRLVGYEL